MRFGCGAGLLLLGALCGIAYLAAAVLAATDPQAGPLALMAGGGAALCGLAGLVAIWVGVVPTAADDAEPRHHVPTLAWVMVFGALLLVGQVTIALLPAAAPVAIPPLHFLAALVPALALTGWLAWRARFARLIYGGCIAAGVALMLEALVATAALVAIVLLVMRTPDGRAAIASFQRAFSGAGAAAPADIEALLPQLLQPAVIAGALILFGVVGPIVEELAKLSGIVLRTPQTARQCWLQGVAIGAGFGVTEAIALGATGFAGWPATMMVRATATVMHASMTGLAALGWFALVHLGNRRLAAAGVGLAFAGHGLWNTLVLVTVLAAAAAAGSSAPWLAALAGVAGGGLVLLWALIFTAFLAISARLRRASPAPD